MRLYRALYLQRDPVILCCLDVKVLCCLDLLLLESIFFKCKLCFFEQDITQQTFVLVKTYWRRLENVFSVTFFCLPRRLEDVLGRCIANTFWRRLPDVWKTKSVTLKTSSRRLEEVLENKKCLLGSRSIFISIWYT